MVTLQTALPAAYQNALSTACPRAGLQMDRVSFFSVTVPSSAETQVHGTVIVPHDAERLVLLAGGFRQDTSSLANVLARFAAARNAVLLYEPHGSGLVSTPYSVGNPFTNDARSMTAGFTKILKEGVPALLGRLPDYFPVHVLAHCMGGTTVLDHFSGDNFTESLLLPLADGGVRGIASLTLLNPGLHTSGYYRAPWNYVLPLLARGALLVSRGHLGHLTSPVFRVAGFDPKPVVIERIRDRRVQPTIPLLWMLCPTDRDINPVRVREYAAMMGGEHTYVTGTTSHTPFRQNEIEGVVSSLQMFWNSVERGESPGQFFERL